MADTLFGFKERKLVRPDISKTRLETIMNALSVVIGQLMPQMKESDILEITVNVRQNASCKVKKTSWRPDDLEIGCKPCSRLKGCSVAQMYGSCRKNCDLFKEITNEK